MSAFQVARIPRCDPARFTRVEAGILAKGPPRPLLVLAGLGEPALLLGRHQRASSAVDLERARARGLLVARRAGGGRELLVGHGVIGVFLWVPPGDPLVAGPLSADRAMNRYLRGLLAGLRSAGAPSAAWFGRDFVSAEGRQLAVVSQEGTAAGGTALEAIVAVSRPLAVPNEFTRYPPHRDARAGGPRPVTLEDLRGKPIAFEELAAAIEQGYAAAYEREAGRADRILPEASVPPAEEEEAGFAASGLHEIPVGFAEAQVALEGGRIARARLRGDLIAPAFVIEALEADLGGVRAEPDEVGPQVDAAFRRPHAFVHGVRELRVLTDAILSAAR